MARDFMIPGECMAAVKGPAGSSIANLSNLGLCSDQVRVRLNYEIEPITLNAWGEKVPVDAQVMLASASVSLNLINFDRTVLEECVRLSQGGPSAAGTMPRAGTRLGGGFARFAAGCNLISLNLTSPVAAYPWRFLTGWIDTPTEYPIGTQKSIVAVSFTAIPYSADPWNNGLGASGVVVWDHTLDT